MQEFSREDVLADYVDLRARQDPTLIADMKGIRRFFDDAKTIRSTHRSPRGMREGGTMRFMGSIDIAVWRADEILRPHLSTAERAKDLLRRFPEFSVDSD